jgi:hypothetical protein
MYVRTAIGALVSIVLIVAALWTWGVAWELADKAKQPGVAVWAVRCAALAAAAAGQVMLTMVVIGGLFRRGLLDNILNLAASLICALSIAGAAALALAGR